VSGALPLRSVAIIMAVAERVPWPAAPVACSGPGRPPIRIARARLLMPVARNRIKFIEIAIHLRRNRPDIPHPRNGPFFLNRRVPGRKSVIAVADGGFLRRPCGRTTSRSTSELGRRCVMIGNQCRISGGFTMLNCHSPVRM
jgi:hypothetical protein